MYESPGMNNVEVGGVRDVAMSTAWVDELPFLTGSWRAGVDRDALFFFFSQLLIYLYI